MSSVGRPNYRRKRMASQKSTKADPADDSKWTWEVDSELMHASSGDIAALFRAEGVDTPGILAIDPPSSETSLFAREAIQNSWDAAREWRATCEKEKWKVEPFSIDFKFVELTGGARRRLVDELGLVEHQSRFDSVRAGGAAKNNLGLAENDLLGRLHDADRPIRLLVMQENSGLGMPGPFIGSDSRIVQALLRTGFTEKADGAGGNYGYGKAGMIQASALRVVVAYTAFRATGHEPDVTRRLIGVTFWKSHKRPNPTGKADSFTGWARLGRRVPMMQKPNGSVVYSAVPFENDEADRVAASLGLDVRDPNSPGGTGTTFVLLEPTIDAGGLKSAIERYWWPAIMDPASGLRARIVDYDGSEQYPSVPKHDPNFAPFIRAFELATRPQDNPHAEEASADLGEYKPRGATKPYPLGKVGIVADTKGWSFPDDGLDHRTLVALVRGPRMVVNYLTFGNIGLPHVRGTFVADPSVDDLLRQTEDKAHTKWETSRLANAHEHAHLVAGEVNGRLRTKVLEFKNKFRPPAPRPGDLNLPLLDELSRLMKGNKPKKLKVPPRAVSISFVDPAHAVATKSGLLKCEATVEFSVADWVWEAVTKDVTDVEVTVGLSVAFVEDEKVGEKLTVKATSGNPAFSPVVTSDGSAGFVGELARGDVARFTVTSDEYESDWTVRFTPVATVTRPKVVPPPKPKESA